MNSKYLYKLPKKDFALLKENIDNLVKNKKPLNIGLCLNKYVDYSEEEPKIKKQIQLFPKSRLGIPNSVIPLNEYKNYFGRLTRSLELLKIQGYSVETFSDLKIGWRLIVNLGAESVYETSIGLHRNYSMPVIPGSAVKGVAHAYAERYKSQSKEEIFGTQEQAGKVIFFDAIPLPNINNNFLVLDIMNAHYGDWYQDKSGRISPGDWMDPNPIFFLAVEKLQYKFSVASREEKLAKKASQILREAIRENGIGAKTSAGYGYFE